MRIRNLDNKGDWTFGRSNSDYVTNNKGVGLNIETKLKEFKHDCFFNGIAGIDWRTRLGMKGQKELLDQDIKDIIIAIPEILALTEYEGNLEDRQYFINFLIVTIFSEEPQSFNFVLGV